MQEYEKTRSQIPFVAFVPHLFRSDEPPLRPPEKFGEYEKLHDFNSMINANFGVITYIRLTDIPLKDKQLKSLGKMVCTFIFYLNEFLPTFENIEQKKKILDLQLHSS